ncbi:MAG: sugar ABC transporter ATP-binding protein [Oscillospiraceae bacterium]|jgi:ribose transport system ATP-binding protein|nr:sugar ABC transporter ATP-binding protein [Oscillospiraceae bacterium]
MGVAENDVILEIRGLCKSFGPTVANKSIDFTLRRGEIHGLIGENGSGKSTLISQIAGMYGSDGGTMTLRGEPYAPRSPLDANAARVSMVVQELGVVGALPAGVNVFLGRTKEFSKFGIVSLKSLYRAAAEQFSKWDLPQVELGGLTDGMMVETRKMIELARAMSVDPEVLILDEITQSLSYNNRAKLYELLPRFKAMGRSVVVITHDVEELIRITDRVTVLRDGEVAGELVSADTDANEIKRLMVGREISGEYYRADLEADFDEADVVLEARGVSVAGELEDVSFELHCGEILGFCGISDSGIHTVGRALYGLEKLRAGQVLIDGQPLKSPTTALRRRMAYVPKDRDSDALMMHASILENFALPSLIEAEGKVGYLSPRRLRALAQNMSDRMQVKCRNIFQTMTDLSGGNKQKVNLGRWLAKDIRVLILDCPTRGVDVGVKAYIYALMKEAKAEGIATILISDELTEALGMSDRLCVMKDGVLKTIIPRGDEFTEHSLIKVMV